MLDIPTTWQLGQEIELGPELKQAAREYCGGQRRRAAWKLSARFVVRGHWRNQACGPKLVERRRQWIQPYWKGAEGGGISHMYTDATAR